MKSILCVLVFLLAASAAPVLAQSSDTRLHWNDCDGPLDLAFDCATNSGSPYVLQWSVQPPSGVNQCVGVEAILDIRLCGRSSVPAWWQFKNAGSCRLNALTVQPSTLDAGCIALWPSSVASIFTYETLLADVGAQHVRLKIAAAVPASDAMTLDPSADLDVFQIRIARSSSTGAGSCEGCSTPAMLYPTVLTLVQPTGVGDFQVLPSPGPGVATVFGGYCPPPDGARSTTWGRIKAQYR